MDEEPYRMGKPNKSISLLGSCLSTSILLRSLAKTPQFNQNHRFRITQKGSGYSPICLRKLSRTDLLYQRPLLINSSSKGATNSINPFFLASSRTVNVPIG